MKNRPDHSSCLQNGDTLGEVIISKNIDIYIKVYHNGLFVGRLSGFGENQSIGSVECTCCWYTHVNFGKPYTLLKYTVYRL